MFGTQYKAYVEALYWIINEVWFANLFKVKVPMAACWILSVLLIPFTVIMGIIVVIVAAFYRPKVEKILEEIDNENEKMINKNEELINMGTVRIK